MFSVLGKMNLFRSGRGDPFPLSIPILGYSPEKVAGYSFAILNLITCTNFRIRYSILEAHLGPP